MWVDLETVLQNEVSQKEKNKYSVIALICGIQKNGTDELIGKAERVTGIEDKLTVTNVGRGMNWEIGIDIYTLLYIKQITKENLFIQHREVCSVICDDLNGKEI